MWIFHTMHSVLTGAVCAWTGRAISVRHPWSRHVMTHFEIRVVEKWFVLSYFMCIHTYNNDICICIRPHQLNYLVPELVNLSVFTYNYRKSSLSWPTMGPVKTIHTREEVSLWSYTLDWLVKRNHLFVEVTLTPTYHNLSYVQLNSLSIYNT